MMHVTKVVLGDIAIDGQVSSQSLPIRSPFPSHLAVHTQINSSDSN